MKLSQMTTNQAADALLVIAPDIETLIKDDILVGKIKNRKTTKDKGKAGILGGLAALDVATYLLKNHRDETWNILGTLNGKTQEEIGSQIVFVTINQVVEALTDNDLASFFSPFASQAQQMQSESLQK